jgi:hypothetical protein
MIEGAHSGRDLQGIENQPARRVQAIAANLVAWKNRLLQHQRA